MPVQDASMKRSELGVGEVGRCDPCMRLKITGVKSILLQVRVPQVRADGATMSDRYEMTTCRKGCRKTTI